jgi:hypothetical protein
MASGYNIFVIMFRVSNVNLKSHWTVKTDIFYRMCKLDFRVLYHDQNQSCSDSVEPKRLLF